MSIWGVMMVCLKLGGILIETFRPLANAFSMHTRVEYRPLAAHHIDVYDRHTCVYLCGALSALPFSPLAC